MLNVLHMYGVNEFLIDEHMSESTESQWKAMIIWAAQSQRTLSIS